MPHNNLFFFNYSKDHPEPIFDPYYIKDKIIIPPTPAAKNKLTQNNERLIDLITAFDVNQKLNKVKNPATDQIVLEIKKILDKVENINYSALCQFFMVYNSSYASYTQMKNDEKIDFLYEILKLYCKKRWKRPPESDGLVESCGKEIDLKLHGFSELLVGNIDVEPSGCSSYIVAINLDLVSLVLLPSLPKKLLVRHRHVLEMSMELTVINHRHVAHECVADCLGVTLVPSRFDETDVMPVACSDRRYSDTILPSFLLAHDNTPLSESRP